MAFTFMNMKTVKPAIPCLALLFLVGCSSVGSHVSSGHAGDVTKAIFLEPVLDDIRVFIPRIVSFLEQRGFVFIHDRIEDSLRLRFTYDPDVWNRTVGIELLDSRQPVVLSRSVNPGWGNIIAGGSSTAHLARTASDNFENHCAAWLKTVTLRDSKPGLAGGIRRTGKMIGTGFCVSSNGMVMTAAHLVSGATRITLKFSETAVWEAKLEKIDIQNDLALLRTSRSTTNFLELGSCRSVSLGETVFTLGFPAPDILGEQLKFSGGQISSLSGLRGTESLIQVTTPIQPGNSGGPVMTENGIVVGIITSSAAFKAFLQYTGTLPQNVNWAVKADYALLLVGNMPVASRSNRPEKSELGKAICLVAVE